MSQTPPEGTPPPTTACSSVTVNQQYAYEYYHFPTEYRSTTVHDTVDTPYFTPEQQEATYPYSFPRSGFENDFATSTADVESPHTLTGSYTAGESSSTAPVEVSTPTEDSALSYGGYRSDSMKSKRRDKVRVMMGDVPQVMPTLFSEVGTVDITGKLFNLTVVEQPQNCRASGFSNTDKRPINPTPIVHLLVTDQYGRIDLESFQNPFFALHVSLSSVDKTQKYDCVVPPSRTNSASSITATSLLASSSSFATEAIMDLSEPTTIAQFSPSSGTTIQEPATPEKRELILLGSLICSGSTYTGLDQQRGIYFAFPDLSIRLPGSFRLHFNLMLLGRSDAVIAEVYSNPFTVYTAKAFPGMKETSELAVHLSKQGLKIPLRNKVRRKRKKLT